MLIGEDIFVIPGAGECCNTYVVLGTEEYVVVDPGLPRPFAEIAGPLKNARFEPKKIRRVVNTHCHVDHVGANGALDEALTPSPEFYVHSMDLVYVQNGDPVFTLSGGPLKPILVNNPMEEGDMIPGTGFAVLHTPGHTLGSICLYDGERRILVSGDTVFGDGVGRFDLPGGSLESLRKSLEKLAGLDVHKLLPGHGEYLESGGGDAISRGLETTKDFRSYK